MHTARRRGINVRICRLDAQQVVALCVQCSSIASTSLHSQVYLYHATASGSWHGMAWETGVRACLLVVEHRDGDAPLPLPGDAPVVAANNHGGDAALPAGWHPLHLLDGCQRVVPAQHMWSISKMRFRFSLVLLEEGGAIVV